MNSKRWIEVCFVLRLPEQKQCQNTKHSKPQTKALQRPISNSITDQLPRSRDETRRQLLQAALKRPQKKMAKENKGRLLASLLERSTSAAAAAALSDLDGISLHLKNNQKTALTGSKTMPKYEITQEQVQYFKIPRIKLSNYYVVSAC